MEAGLPYLEEAQRPVIEEIKPASDIKLFRIGPRPRIAVQCD
jgi:hypothetical protein